MDKNNEFLKDIPAVLEDSGCSYLQFNSSYDLIYASPLWYQYTGYTEESMKKECQNRITSVIHPDDFQKMKASIARQLSMGKCFNFEFRCVTRSKSIRWLNIRGICTVKNKQMVYSAIAYDITESKESYKELLQAKNELDLIAYQLEGGILKMRAEDFKIIYANEGFYRLGGYSKSEYLAKFKGFCSGIIHPEDAGRINRIIKKVIRERNTFTAEYRIMHKNGGIRWSRCVGNFLEEQKDSTILLCILMDITESKEQEERLLLEQKKHNLLCSLNHEYLWEYDPKTRLLTRDGDLEGTFSPEKSLPDGFNYPIKHNFVHPDDVGKLKKFQYEIENSASNISVDVRMKNEHGAFVWYKIQGVTMKDSEGCPVHIIGKTSNIDDSRQHLELLKDEAKQDSLTHLLNREFTEKRINKYLKSKDTAHDSAMVILDIKRCKTLQQKYGQLFTDSVIQEISVLIKNLFSDAIIGRTGFDIFTIFIPKIESRDKISGLASEAAAKVSSIETGQENQVRIRCHIGISISNEPDDSFAALFKKADMALFYAKMQDKDYEFFGEHTLEDEKPDLTALSDDSAKARTSLRKFIWTSEDYSLMSAIMGIFTNEENVPNAIHMVMEKLAGYFQADQVFITEYQPQENVSRVTYAYYGPGAPPPVEPMQSQPLDKVQGFEKLFNSQGIFFTNDISVVGEASPYIYEFLKYTSVLSIIDCSFVREGEFAGFLSINDYKKKRIWKDEDLNLIKSITDIINYVLIKYNKEQLMLYNKSYDIVSGLPSFTTFLIEGNRMIQKSKENSSQEEGHKKLALISMDIQKFHLYNMNYGFSVGNKVLFSMANRLRDFTEPGEICTRLQGDVFYALIQYENLGQLEPRISAFFSESNINQMTMPDYAKFLVACGIYLIEDEDEDLSEVLDKADYARHSTKNIKGSSYSIYSNQMGRQQHMEMNIRELIKKALIDREINVLYQPKYDLLTDNICGAEALVRWSGQDGRQVFPDVILPILQQERLMADLDFYVIDEVCQRLVSIRDKNKKIYPISVGLSAVQLQNPDFLEQLMDVVSTYQIPANYLQLEIEERSFLEEPDAMVPFIHRLSEKGFYIILSHFGSVSGSLDILAKFPVDVVKFDLNYFRKHIEEDKTKILLQKVIESAHAMGQKVAIVGLESQLQKAFLYSIGCDYIQGYLYHKPLPADAFEKYLCKSV